MALLQSEVKTVILVNEAQGYRVCLECREPFGGDDEAAWMTRHADCAPPSSAA